MTPRAALVLAALLAAGCSSSSEARPMGSATVTLFGPAARLETWKTSVVEGWHVHPSQPEDPCTVPVMAEMVTMMTTLLQNEKKEQAEKLQESMGTVMGNICGPLLGPSYGGKGRVAIVLRHYRDGEKQHDETLVVDVPRLQRGENERIYRKGEFQAAFLRSPTNVEALLDRGWVRAIPTKFWGRQYELFLVLKPIRPDAGYESIQVVTRVSGAPTQ